MKITNHLDSEQLQQRDSLLIAALRPDYAPFAISDEYPIVLSHANTQNSHCLIQDNRVIAHANLWPRILISASGNAVARIGLIGNVATASSYRGKGIMSHLMRHLRSVATQSGLDALLLWSDMPQFYQKLDYQSFGREVRYEIPALGPSQSGQPKFFPVRSDQVRDSELRRMLSLRPATTLTIQRNLHEFRQLLTIPETHLFCCYANSQICGYAIVGKGCDMGGVVHEWGVAEASLLNSLVNSIGEQMQLERLLVLSPASLPPPLAHCLAEMATNTSEHVMALACLLSDRCQQIAQWDQTFIWGLDSI